MRPRKGLLACHAPSFGPLRLWYTGEILANVAVMPSVSLAARLVPRFALLACLSFGTSVSAGEPQTAPTDEGAYQQERSTAMPAKEAGSGGPTTFERGGCLNDPSKCKCQNTDKAKGQACAAILGHFCPDSTLRYLASACMDLFGGAALCQCAPKKQIETLIKAEDAAKAKADKKAAADAKKKKAKTK